MRSTAPALLLLAAVSSRSSWATPLQEAAAATSDASIEQELVRIARYINHEFAENRVESLIPYVASDVTVFSPAGGGREEGSSRMIEGLRRAASAKTTHRWEERDFEVQVYGEVGIVTFLYDHDATREGKRASRSYRATYVFHRIDDEWLLVHDHTSPYVASPLERPNERP